MKQEKIEKYFAKKGIKVIFNTLGHTPELIHSFVSDYKDVVDRSQRKKSQDVKITTYSDMYTFEPRPKLTGFENYKKKDNEFRKTINKFIVESQYSPSLKIENYECNSKKSYKQLLSDSLEKIENPLLYLSGGMDSQLVAKAFLEKNIKFKTVVFEYVDDKGTINNIQDVNYAYSFCKQHGIIPQIEQINIDKLWDSNYFKKLAIEVQYLSPQLLTYVHMVNLMSVKYANATHLFGGEVRFFTNYVKENNEIANVVLLAKVVPTYNGQNYFNISSCNQSSQTKLFYFGDGSAAIIGYTFGGLEINEQIAWAGFWYADGPPTSPFGYKVKWILYSFDSYNGYIIAPAASGVFQNIDPEPTVGTEVVGVTAIGASFSGSNYATLEADIECKETNNPDPGVFATLIITASAICF